MMVNRIHGMFHCLVTALVIVHVAVCSEFFGGTALWSYLTLLCEAAFIFLLFEYVWKIKSLNKIEVISIIYFVYLLIVSFFCGCSNANVLALVGRAVEIAILMMVVRIDKDNLKPYFVTSTIVFSLCVYINFYFVLIEPTGMIGADGNTFYFLGTNYNQIGPKVVFAFLFSAILAKNNKLALANLLCVSIVGLISLLIVQSMTSTVCLSLLLFVYFNSVFHRLNRLTLYALWSFFFLFQVLVVFGGATFSTTYALDFLSFIGKEVTFTGRTVLWNYSADYFFDSPIFGHGYVSAIDYFNSGFFHGIQKASHNYVYSIMHKGGFVLITIFICMFFIAYKRIRNYKDRHAFIVMMTCAIFFVMSLFESYDSIYTYMLLILMYYYENICDMLHNQCFLKNGKDFSYYPNI